VSWQLLTTGVIIAVAAAYVIRAILCPLFGRGRSSCGSGCGKCNTPAPPPAPGRIGLPQFPSSS